MKKYQIIYADPPWSYYNDSSAKPDCTTVKGMRRPPYPVMGSDEIANLPINNISDENCILFIWTTDYHLEKCFKVINKWGFTYKTIGFTWQKLNKQNKPVCFMGAYTMKSGVEFTHYCQPIMKTETPIICSCDAFDSPNLGVFEQLGYKACKLTSKETIKLNLLTKDDMWDRYCIKYFVIYKGKRPKLSLNKKYYWVEELD